MPERIEDRAAGHRLPWPVVLPLAAAVWYLLVGGTWLVAELVVPTLDGTVGSPPALPLLPAELLRLTGAAPALAAGALIGVFLWRRPARAGQAESSGPVR